MRIIKRIRARNFKSFEKLEIELGRFNVLIGANASGKSNFVQIFKFLKDIANSGLNNAMSMQGGAEYLRNINLGASENLSIEVVFEEAGLVRKGLIGIKAYETIYEFALKFHKRGPGFRVVEDRLNQKYKFIKLEKQGKKFEEKEILGDGEILISRSNGKVKIDSNIPEKIPLKEKDVFPFLRFLQEVKLPNIQEVKLPNNVLLLQTPYFFPFFLIEQFFSEISIYDFDPKLPKRATPITGKAELEEDGSNLSIILKNILEDEEKKRKLFNLVKDLLPFITNLGVEKFADKSLMFKLEEAYFKNQYLPASLISDGTINITALIIALYFEKKPLVIIEEPERNIHPYLISKVVDMMKDASREKQIIVTTHNPEIVKHASLENLLLVSRDEGGFSTISRPADKEKVKTFLENEIGIEELYIQNLLEA
jgi:predicted ATPase